MVMVVRVCRVVRRECVLGGASMPGVPGGAEGVPGGAVSLRRRWPPAR